MTEYYEDEDNRELHVLEKVWGQSQTVDIQLYVYLIFTSVILWDSGSWFKKEYGILWEVITVTGKSVAFYTAPFLFIIDLNSLVYKWK